MVAATLVDIIRRFKVNKTEVPDDKEELFKDFPEKVSFLMNYWGWELTVRSNGTYLINSYQFQDFQRKKVELKC